MSRIAELVRAQPVSEGAASPADTSTLTDRIRAILPQIRAAIPRTTAERRVPDDIIEALRRAGMWRVYVPKEYGGTEESVLEVARAIRLVARVCPSTAWVIGVLCAHPFITSLYSRRMQDEFWAEGPDTLASTAGLPINRGRIVEGGIRVSGRFPFSSGSVNATWAMVGVSVPDMTALNPERNRTGYFCLVPRSDYAIDDDWHVMGLGGTASRTLVFDDVFIPAYRMEMSASLAGCWSRGQGLHEGWLWNAGYTATIGTALTPVSLGIADTMLEMITGKVKGRTVPGTRMPTNSIPNSMRLAESVHELRAISLFWEDSILRTENIARAGEIPDEDDRADSMAAAIYTQEVCTRLVDRLFAVAGGSSVRLDSPIQAFWRDAHTARSHISAEWDAAAQIFGRHLLDLPPQARWGGTGG